MSKKTNKPPKIDPRILTRPRLDALFERRARDELDDAGLFVAVQALIADAGQLSVVDALVTRMHGTPEGERDSLMILVERLKSREVIDHLWRRVKKAHVLPVDAKMTVLTILKQMGEDVDLADPELYFSPREIQPSDVQLAQGMFRSGIRGMARDLRAARNPVEVERMMLDINRMHANAPDGQLIYQEMIKTAEEDRTDLGADFLFVLAHTSPFPDVRAAAARALERLAVVGIKPVTRVLLALTQDRFYAAYMTDPQHPWQQSVTVAWERAGGVLQALTFLLDFGVPWRGALKDMFATRGMTPKQFQHEYIERSEKKMGERVYRVKLARAQAAIAAAVQANRKHKVQLPKAYEEMCALVERWVLHPPEEAVTADQTRDELSHLPLVPDRRNIPSMVDLRDVEHNEALRRFLAQPPDENEDDK